MKKAFALATTAILALAVAAPVAADTYPDGNPVDGVVTEKTAIHFLDGIDQSGEYFAVCTYPGDKSANWLIPNGHGGLCLKDPEGTMKVLPIAALKAFIKE